MKKKDESTNTGKSHQHFLICELNIIDTLKIVLITFEKYNSGLSG